MPPENFEILGALRCILGHIKYIALACQRSKFIFSSTILSGSGPTPSYGTSRQNYLLWSSKFMHNVYNYISIYTYTLYNTDILLFLSEAANVSTSTSSDS